MVHLDSQSDNEGKNLTYLFMCPVRNQVPSQGMVPPMVRVGLSASVRRFVSVVIPNLVKLQY